jgi:CRISPR-associated endonuclease/helicase Cas3
MTPFPDFKTFTQELWGHLPFPWQERLADLIETTGKWPPWITLPTGCGKTSALDIAVYDLARQAHLPPAERTASVRIILAVNRRIVVDDAFARAREIQDRLAQALEEKSDLLHPVAIALLRLSGKSDGLPLESYALRGATFTDHSWARTPTQPLIIATTLDQLGSRLLFRGYGVSNGARPIHAALLANDALLILDEAHSELAFSETLTSITNLRQTSDTPLENPFSVVQLTATPPPGTSNTFELDTKDRENPTIRQRLTVSKPTSLIEVHGAKGAARHKKLTAEISAEIPTILETNARRILIVVNRVETAQQLFNHLSKPAELKKHQAAVRLLTGRLRPLDRDEVLEQTIEKHELKSRKPSQNVPPLILIATQTIEVGADLDFDALLTELAPLDNLKQRFGRLNRYGRETEATGIIFAPEIALDKKQNDPLYGPCLPLVWTWLSALETLDFGIDAMEKNLPGSDILPSLIAPKTSAPILLPQYLDLLAQTSPPPHAEPEVAHFIHGPGRDFEQVSICLRSDLLDEKGEPLPCAEGILTDLPPLVTEQAAIPLAHVRNWLSTPGRAKDDSGDDVSNEEPLPRSRNVDETLRAWKYANGEASLLKVVTEIRAGDVLVISSQTSRDYLGKLLPLPGVTPWELDQYEAAHIQARDKIRIRLGKTNIDHLQSLLPAENRKEFKNILGDALWSSTNEDDKSFSEKEVKKVIPTLINYLSLHLPEKSKVKEIWGIANQLQRKTTDDWQVSAHPQSGAIISHADRLELSNWPLLPEDLGQQTTNALRKIELDPHNKAVATVVERFLQKNPLPEEIHRAVIDAALYHDLGKIDPRFQAQLHGVTLLAALGKVPLAKSQGQHNRSVREFYRRQADLPKRFRHELLSTLIVAQSKFGEDHPEHVLLLHLIASHHGHCRAMAPIVHDLNPEPFFATVDGEKIRYSGHDTPLAHIDSGVTERYTSLTRRFGWWGLAYLETILRLADQRESANPSSSD